MLPASTPLARHLAAIVAGLYGVIAPRAAAERARTALLVLVITRLNRMVGRLDCLVARWRAGTLALPRRAPAGQHREPSPRAPLPRKPVPGGPLPAGHAWLIRLVQPTAQFSGQVQVLLATADCQALIAAAPQAGRIFRPLCRMLGIELPPPLRLPPRIRRRRPKATPPSDATIPTEPRPIRPIGYRPLALRFSAG